MFNNLFIVYVVVFITVNISLLSPQIHNNETQYVAIHNLLIFLAWFLTMNFLYNPHRVNLVLNLYSAIILGLLMYHTISNWLKFHYLIPDEEFSVIMSNQQVYYLKSFLLWFDTFSFFFVIYFLENRHDEL